jgi:hypothetical protein
VNDRRQRGQASVELVASVPILLLALLAVAQLALAGYAVWTAGAAARAGARAAYVGGSAEPAARSALPVFLRSEASVSEGDGVEVRVRTPALVPGMPAIPIAARAGLDVEEAAGG